MLGWETRKKLIQEYHKGVSEPKKVATVEKLQGLSGFFPVSLHHYKQITKKLLLSEIESSDCMTFFSENIVKLLRNTDL